MVHFGLEIKMSMFGLSFTFFMDKTIGKFTSQMISSADECFNIFMLDVEK